MTVKPARSTGVAEYVGGPDWGYFEGYVLQRGYRVNESERCTVHWFWTVGQPVRAVIVCERCAWNRCYQTVADLPPGGWSSLELGNNFEQHVGDVIEAHKCGGRHAR